LLLVPLDVGMVFLPALEVSAVLAMKQAAGLLAGQADGPVKVVPHW
jgi:hypothetical protein